MAQLVLMAAQLVCGLPAAHFVGPVIASCIPVSPINLIMYGAWFFFLKTTKYQWAQKYKGSTKTLLKNALMFYFITALPLYFLLVSIACKAASYA